MRVAAAEVSLLRSAARITGRRFRASVSQGAVGAGSKVEKNAKSAKINSDSCSSDLDAILKEYLSSSVKPFQSSSSEVSVCSEGINNTKARKSLIASSSTSLLATVSNMLKPDAIHDNDESASQLSDHVSSVLRDGMHQDLKVERDEEDESAGGVLEFPLLSKMSNSDLHMGRKSMALAKKKRYFRRQGQTGRFGKVVRICAKALGPDVALDLFGREGASVTEVTALIDTYLKAAISSINQDQALVQINKVYQIFKVIKGRGFRIDEDKYGQLLLYLIENEMVEEFFMFHEILKEENLPRLAYYEMLLWIRVKNETKVQELFRSAVFDASDENCCIKESLLLALAESNHKEEFLTLLETLDITRVLSTASLVRIFGALGRFLLEQHLEEFLLALKSSGIGAEKVSSLICEYAVNVPNLAKVDDVIMTLKALNAKFDVLPTSAQYEKLVKFYCEHLKVDDALVVADDALQTGVTLYLEALHMIFDACDQSCEFYLVHEIFSRMSAHSIKPDSSTFKRAVLLCTKMKDYQGAYQMIEEMKNMRLEPTAVIYNIILGGYFREKNSLSAMKVLKQMEDAGVEPDSTTYTYLINNSRSEKDVIKFYDRMIKSGVHLTKQIFMALINAYASCGQIEKAKQVITDERISGEDLNEIKNALVGALASNGQLPVALEMYEEIKGAKCHTGPKTIKHLIENLESEDMLDKSLDLLEEINDSQHWPAAFLSIMSCCFRFENMRCAAELLKRLKDKFIDNEIGMSVVFDEVFCMFAEKERTDMHFGLSLLQVAKDEIGISPTRKSLDFLLSACVSAKDSAAAFRIWKEYEASDFAYDVLSYMRMYQALLASGDKKSAEGILEHIPRADPGVCSFIKACNEAYKKQQK